MLKLGLCLIGLAVAFPTIASLLLWIDVHWVQQVALGFGLVAYFGSFMMICAGVVLVLVAIGIAAFTALWDMRKV